MANQRLITGGPAGPEPFVILIGTESDERYPALFEFEFALAMTSDHPLLDNVYYDELGCLQQSASKHNP